MIIVSKRIPAPLSPLIFPPHYPTYYYEITFSSTDPSQQWPGYAMQQSLVPAFAK